MQLSYSRECRKNMRLGGEIAAALSSSSVRDQRVSLSERAGSPLGYRCRQFEHLLTAARLL
jgi:hypothetical protein